MFCEKFSIIYIYIYIFEKTTTNFGKAKVIHTSVLSSKICISS